ncbi:sensor histidine kinase [Halosquirtibacter laminarini]|uniref:Sensor histidine kinase n=1 Tax=Halosquirtibacter laminarini TaxID=3374600 RepID=A0AC61NGB7_9BACT|nr:sensor histidine kinase [Prolixibacteraceae bacterium]
MNRVLFDKLFKHKKVGWHVLFWCLYLLMIYLFILGFSDRVQLPWFSMVPLFLQIPLFYTNYSCLLPRFFNRKKIWIYLFANLLLILLVLLISVTYHRSVFISFSTFFDSFNLDIKGGFIKETPFIFSNVLSCLAILFFSSMFYLYEVRLMDEKNEMELNSQLKRSQYQLLKTQINPHFLFNALNNIYTLSVVKSEKTSQSILDLSSLLRYVIYDCDSNYVSISQEIGYIEHYIKLIKLKDDSLDNIRFMHEITDDVGVAPMLLIPFVENSFKHSNFEDSISGFVDIELSASSERIHFRCINSIGKVMKKTDAVGGIGVNNVLERLNTLYGERCLVNIDHQKDVYIVDIKIVLMLYGDH